MRIKEIVVDCENAPVLARFWAAALDGYDVRPYDDEEIARLEALGFTPDTDPGVAVDGPGPTLFFQQVPEGKATKNRIHLDIVGGPRKDEVAALRRRGATVYAEMERDGQEWTVMQDPEGNEFCVLDPP